eukprot:jgi/Hompol1/6618/HPOL_003612-RA
MAPLERKMDQAKSFLGGGFAGVATVLAGHPFDTLKVRLQTSNEYKGLADCFRKTVARDGLAGLYKGISSPLVGVTPMFGASLSLLLSLSLCLSPSSEHCCCPQLLGRPLLYLNALHHLLLVNVANSGKCFLLRQAYEVGQQLVYSFTPNRKSKDLSMLEFAIAGGFSAIPTTIVTTPMERVKVVLQTQDQAGSTGKKYKGMFDAGAGMFKEGGLSSLYRGTVATLARDIPGSAAYFVAYEYFYRLLKKENESISIGAVLFSGGMAGVAMWSIAIPPDVVKSRMQAAPAGTYKGFIDCTAQIIAKEGAGALFKGLGPALLRAFPANAAGFLGRAASLEVMHRLW